MGVLSQSKLLFTAALALVLRGRGQSRRQWAALALISVAASAAAGEGARRGACAAGGASLGVAAALAAAALSGLGAVLSEVVLVVEKRDILCFSAQLSLGGVLVSGLALFLDLRGCGGSPHAGSIFAPWTSWTVIPVLASSVGGILVGVMTKALGSVGKALTVTAALLLSAVLRTATDRRPPSAVLCTATLIAALGVRLYCGPRCACAVPDGSLPPAVGLPSKLQEARLVAVRPGSGSGAVGAVGAARAPGAARFRVALAGPALGWWTTPACSAEWALQKQAPWSP